MKNLIVLSLFTVAAIVVTPAAQAKGCIKGAAVGAVAGHVAGHHAVVGAVGGCIVGRHLANKKAVEDKARAAPQQTPAPANDGHAGAART